MSSIVPWPSCGGRSSSIYPTNEGAPLISSRRTSGNGWQRKTATFNVRTIVGAAISLTLQLVWKDMGRDLVEEDFAPNIKSWRITDTTLPKKGGERKKNENLARIFLCVISTRSCALPISTSAILVFPSALFAAASTRLA